MRTTTTLILAILAASFAAGPGWAAQSPGEGIKTGFLVIEGQRIDPPFVVAIADGKVLVNGIQTYPRVPSPREVAANAEKEEARRFLDSLHEDFLKREQLHGHDDAAGWLKGELKKFPGYGNATVKETKMGLEVNLKGVDSVENATFIRYIRKDNAPKNRADIQALRTKLQEQYGQWRKQLGKGQALKKLEETMKREPLVDDEHINPDESYSVRWKGSPDVEGFKMQFPAEGAKAQTPESALDKRLNFEAEEVARPLRLGLCVVFVEGVPYTSFHGEAACKDFVEIHGGKMADKDARQKLQEHFRGSERNLIRHLGRFQKP